MKLIYFRLPFSKTHTTNILVCALLLCSQLLTALGQKDVLITFISQSSVMGPCDRNQRVNTEIFKNQKKDYKDNSPSQSLAPTEDPLVKGILLPTHSRAML